MLQNLSDPQKTHTHTHTHIHIHTHTHTHLKIKAAELVSVFEAEIDHPLGLLKVKAGNLKGILIVRVKLQNSHHMNIRYTTDKKFSRQLPLISFAMGNRSNWQQSDISISQLSEGVEGPDLV